MSKINKSQLDNHSIFIVSKWFKTINDYINLEFSSPKFLGNLNNYEYNPIPINSKTKRFFPNLKTLYIYKPNDEKFKDDEKIIKRIKCKIDRFDLYNQQRITLQNWTKRRLKNVVFDSNIHNWDISNSEFKDKIFNKSNLIFIIENNDGNKFGYYFTRKINKCESWIPSISSFMFSLEYYHNINIPTKIQTRFPINVFCLYHNDSYKLVTIGDICLNKKSIKTSSYCDLDSWNFCYKGNRYLFGENSKDKFDINPKRILVISTE